LWRLSIPRVAWSSWRQGWVRTCLFPDRRHGAARGRESYLTLPAAGRLWLVLVVPDVDLPDNRRRPILRLSDDDYTSGEHTEALVAR